METLGCLQTICMDKTGTITKNEMTVVRIFAGMKEIQTDQEDLSAYTNNCDKPEEHELTQLIKMATLCNETEVLWDGSRQVLSGSATEKALVQLAIDNGMDVIELREQHPIIRIAHRSEQRPFMTTFHTTPTVRRCWP